MRFSARSKLSVLLLAALLTLVGGFAFYSVGSRDAAHAATAPEHISLSGSYIPAPAGAQLLGHHANGSLTIEVAVQSGKTPQLNSLLAALYNPASPQYHQWLAPGVFNSLFGPTAAQTAQVSSFLTGAGLKVGTSSTPFLIRATGTRAQIEAAFHTTINDYRTAAGQSFFQNDSAVQVPASLSGLVTGVIGLSNTVRLHGNFTTTRAAARAAGKPIPTYGAGPGGSGLVPSQTESLYSANQVYSTGSKGKGSGATLAVFELSGYTPADITTYEHQFFGSSENVPLVNINVDGGPITPVCPTGDLCVAPPDYSGDIEVEADIEMQISIAPKISQILVYNAPNDFFGITTTDEYFQIANDDLADSISTSWGLCELDAGYTVVNAESVAFAQMATQGQSIFSASGDAGAFDCLRGSGYPGLKTHDPASQPLVTGVGGTSFGSYDPGTTLHPSYPRGFETVWNVLNECSASNEGACLNLGASGGGVSSFWPMQSYQTGPGVISSFSQKFPFCGLAVAGQYCRETPDVSANADEFTPYAEYCTGNPATNSTCATFSATLTPPGWFGIGGTSLSSPLWSGIIALWDSVHGARFGAANFGLYQLFNSSHAYSKLYHDITGIHQTENNNGYYPVTPDYDMGTGIGTPRISAIAESTI